MFVKHWNTLHASLPWTPLWRKWMKSANKWNFSKSMEHNSAKNCSIVPKIKSDLDFVIINLNTKFHFSSVQRKWTETENKWNFSKSNGYKSVKNRSIVPKTKLDLDIVMMNLYTKSYFQYMQPLWRKWTEIIGGPNDRHTDRQTDKDRQTDWQQQESNVPSLLQRGRGHKNIYVWGNIFVSHLIYVTLFLKVTVFKVNGNLIFDNKPHHPEL